ncbi:hypothetical protein [Rhodobacter ferrooxidans]|nr:hypothetical protein [Rhodobacter sp. SW2]
MGILRLILFGFVGLTVVFVLVSIYARSVQREELEKQFDAGGVDGDRDAYIEAGMRDYRRSLRAKLVWLVYVVPTVVFGVLFYVLNFG